MWGSLPIVIGGDRCWLKSNGFRVFGMLIKRLGFCMIGGEEVGMEANSTRVEQWRVISFSQPPISLKEVCMRRIWLVAVGTMMVLFFGTVTTQYAQGASCLQGNIPFNFMVGDKSFSAGEYSISSTSYLLQLVGIENGQGAYLLTVPGKDTDRSDMKKGKLIFNKFGEQYFLSKVINPSNASELAIRKSKAEKEAEKEVTKSPTVSSIPYDRTVSIAMNIH